MPYRLTPNLWSNEVVVTGTGLPNELPRKYVPHALATAVVVQAFRDKVGRLKVNSWYRSPQVNEEVGGWHASRHLKALAMDVVPLDMELAEAWKILTDMVDAGLPVDQAIRYPTFIHIGISIANDETRREYWAED